MELFWLVLGLGAGAVGGVAAGWRLHARRADTELTRAVEAGAGLARDLEAERGLLDAVADQSGIDREVFRSSLANLSLDEPDTLSPQAQSVVEENRALRVELAEQRCDLEEAHQLLMDLKREVEFLLEAPSSSTCPTEQVIDLRDRPRTDAESDRRIRELRAEVAALRERLADRTLAQDQFRGQAASSASQAARRQRVMRQVADRLDGLADLLSES